MDLGSGWGSRGEVLEYKRQVLRSVYDELQPKSVLDIGCGDMELSSVLPDAGYTGLDLSDVIVEKNRKRFPARSFRQGSFLDIDVDTYQLILLFDVLIHMPKEEIYRGMVQKMVDHSHYGLVAGFNTAFKPDGIVYFYEKLEDTLTKAGATNIKPLGEYRDTTMLLFEGKHAKPSA